MVQILMSTYNGEEFLEEQLNSLIDQSHSKFKILIRDDGSTDDTLKIIRKYQENYNIELIEGKNIGVVASFFELIKNSDSNCEYFAFCDQDDYWEPVKLEKAIEKLENLEKRSRGSAYCSNLKLVDERLNFIKYQYQKKLQPSFENSIVENIVTGCTLVIDKKLRSEVLYGIDKTDVNKILMHDWFIYIIASITGIIVYDEESYILYRQHGRNAVGMEVTFLGKIKRHFNNLRKYKGHRRIQTFEVLKYYEEFLNEENKKIAKKLMNNKLFSGIKRQSKIMTLCTSILVYLKRY